MSQSYVCPHGGPNCPGWYVLNVPFGHPDFGRSFLCECASRRKAERLKWQLPPKIATKRFDCFVVLNENRIAFDAAVTYARVDPPRGWLTITGGVGNGKTHLAAAIANALLDRGVPVMLFAVPALLDEWRSTFAPGSDASFDDRFEAIKQVEVLVLDDLGAEEATLWAQDKLYQVFEHRYSYQLPLVVTSNVQWTKRPMRIRSRLSDTELGKVVINTAHDYRNAEGKRAYQDAR